MYHIGILQLTQHLDDAVQGFKAALAAQNIAVSYEYRNADGNVEALPTLAADLAAQNVDLIFACSTPSAQAAMALPGSIPVVFTPVFDPVGSGLVADLAVPGGKATGVAGMVAADAKMSFMQRLLPQAQKIGMLFAATDPNAVLEMKHFRNLAAPFCELVEIPVATPEELSNLPDMLPADLDALFLPIGRIIEENFASIVYYTDSIMLPIIASHAPNVSAGALGALVANHAALGAECAAKALAILNGTPAGTIPVDIVKQPDILLNAFVADTLGLTLAADLTDEAKEIFE